MSVDLNDSSNVTGTQPAVAAFDFIRVPVDDNGAFPFDLTAGDKLVVGKIPSGGGSSLGDVVPLAEGTVPPGTTWKNTIIIQIQQVPPIPLPPTVSSVSPSEGASLEQVLVQGSHFDTTPSNNIVTFGGVVATVVSGNSIQLFVEVPPTLVVGTHACQVETPGPLYSNTTEELEVLQPTISSVSPLNGRVSAEITIQGTYFSNVIAGNTVKFGSVVATIIEATSVGLVALVPPTAPASDDIDVIVGPNTATGGPFTFTRDDHTLVSLVPNSGSVGASIDINGTNFSDIPGDHVVAFNGIPTPVLSASATVLTVEVPVGATTGPVTVEIGGTPATPANLPFTVV